ncbi:hypothetical protein BGZ63DRAFT_371944 [Mariannaea sp. PMI_226]|nr:hypothetical protein BGZ63DRAFT_371944 [Mariannaea sp. PMI_226]
MMFEAWIGILAQRYNSPAFYRSYLYSRYHGEINSYTRRETARFIGCHRIGRLCEIP